LIISDAGSYFRDRRLAQEHENIRLRFAGMAATFAVLAVMALSLLTRAIEPS
jgi:uncharacterized membrane protein YecN with MAPEG domain